MGGGMRRKLHRWLEQGSGKGTGTIGGGVVETHCRMGASASPRDGAAPGAERRGEAVDCEGHCKHLWRGPWRRAIGTASHREPRAQRRWDCGIAIDALGASEGAGQRRAYERACRGCIQGVCA